MIWACRNTQSPDTIDRAREHFAPLPDLIESREPQDNPITPEKIKLGKMLFYETRISVDLTVSCFKCHWINLYGTDGLQKSIGNNYKRNARNAPTVFNAAGQIAQHWRGDRESVEDQAQKSLIGEASYGLDSYQEAESKLRAIPGYTPLFQNAFPGESQPVTAENFAKAVAAWERTLVTPSRLDAFLEGDAEALDESERAGLLAFIETGCPSCHDGAYVGGQRFARFGITRPYWELTKSTEIDDGRFTVTGNEEDKYTFKVPPLRNVFMTAPYFHDGSVNVIEDAVRIMAALQLGKTLTDAESRELVSFLKALTGRIPEDALEVPVSPSARQAE